ncbi:glycosyltransferase [Silvimonas iriomotensis]|uniref:Glycosyl transferase n=1 Tax=Silvimonas iriomotensis TaxID=449662 RepID=A0ABQ2PBT4_9NEIS|nr:glycosyltransferase [Silvimonas iriomotensis]GGP22806.1 glycosyl transferase [Silvimonas iriomotensis]
MNADVTQRNRIALLIPHFNNPQGMCESLASVGEQEQVDAWVVDDGSVRQPLDEAACRAAWRAQGQLHFVYLPQNQGIEYALNTGLAGIQAAGHYDYVARLDCADLNMPDRCTRQAAYLDAHPDVYLLGSAVVFFDETGDRFTLRQPQTHEEIVRQMHVDNAFTHPAVMFRMTGVAALGDYPVDCKAAEDFAYFWKFVARYRTANLPDVLVRTEYTTAGISLSRRRRQQWSRFKVLLRHVDASPRSWLMLLKPLVWLVVPFGVARQVKQWLGVKSWS